MIRAILSEYNDRDLYACRLCHRFVTQYFSLVPGPEDDSDPYGFEVERDPAEGARIDREWDWLSRELPGHKEVRTDVIRNRVEVVTVLGHPGGDPSEWGICADCVEKVGDRARLEGIGYEVGEVLLGNGRFERTGTSGVVDHGG